MEVNKNFFIIFLHNMPKCFKNMEYFCLLQERNLPYDTRKDSEY